MSDDKKKPDEVATPSAEGETSAEVTNERREFLRKAAAAAIGVGLVGSLAPGEAAAAAPAAAAARTTFTFSSNIVPAALTAENIKKITDRVAASLANEAKSGLEAPVAGFHIRVGGGHSRVFSKTADHKNVSHSEVIIEGSGP